MSFVEVQFPPDISYGATGGPMFSTDITETFGGWEQRNVNWSQARGQWNVSHGVKTETQLAVLLAFFRARRGKAVGFRFKDWSDFKAQNQIIGTGDGTQTAFQIVKSYTSGGTTVDRVIKKPVSGTVQVYKAGVLQSSGYTVNAATGVVTFTAAPTSGQVITVNFEFDVPARFDTDQMDINLETYGASSWAGIPIVEIRV